MTPIFGPGGRDISGDLDNYITGHYGEDDPANQPEPEGDGLDDGGRPDDDPAKVITPPSRTYTEATDEAGEVVYCCLGCKGFAKDPNDIRHDPDCTVQEDGQEFLIEED